MAEKSKIPAIRFAGFTEAWEQCKFEDITYLSGEKNRDNNIFESYSVTNDKGFVPQVEQFENGGTMATADKSMYYIVSKNSFAYNPARINVGSIGYYDKPEKVIVSSLYEVFKTINNINDRFLWHWFKSNAFQKMIEQYQEGGVRLYFYYDKLCVCSIDIPKYEEQYMIGEILDKIDNLITLHQRKYDKLVNVKKAMLEKMFSKDGADVPEIRFKGFTEAWEQRKFIDLFVEKREKTEYENEDTLLSCAINGIFLNSELFGHFRGSSTVGYLRVNKNDLILSAQNLHLGNANVNLRFEHGIISPAYKVYRLNGSNPRFVHTWVKMDDTKNFFLSATTEGASQCRKNIEWETLKKQTILFPSLKEQDKIGKYFEHYDNLITLHQRKLEKLKNLKKACLEKMFV